MQSMIRRTWVSRLAASTVGAWLHVVALTVAAALAGCGGDSAGPAPIAPVTGTAIGGTVTGIQAGNRVVLTDNGGDAITLSADGPFVFPTRLAQDAQFAVAVGTVPAGQSCAVLFGSGAVSNATAVQSTAVICGPAESRTFAPAASMLTARENHQLVKLPNGSIFAFGHATSSIEQYDSRNDAWMSAGVIPNGMLPTSAAVAGKTKILFVATQPTATATPAFSAGLYDPASRTVTATAPFVAISYPPRLIALQDGRVLAVDTDSGAAQNTELYDPATNRWTATGAARSGINAHSDGSLVLMADGNVLYVGGQGADSFGSTSQLSVAEIFNVATGTWSTTGNSLVPRQHATAVLLPNGRVLLVGGVSGRFSQAAQAGPFFVSQAEVYDPPSRQWFLAGVVNTSRIGLTATLMPSGKVLIAGGSDPTTTILYPPAPAVRTVTHASVDAYDPQANTITAWGTLLTSRAQHAAVLTNEGKLLISGGESGILTNPASPFSGTVQTVLASSELGY